MILTLDVFKAAIRALQSNTLDDIFHSLQSVRNHYNLLEQKFKEQAEKLSTTVIYYKKYENQMNWRKNSINTNELSEWVPLFRQHKESNAFPDVKTAAVQRIVKAKKEMDHIDLSLSEVKLRVLEFARNAYNTQGEIKKAATQIFVLESAVDISSFLSSNNYDAKEIADYEYQKYYDLYGRAGNDIG